MRFVDEYRRPEHCELLIDEVRRMVTRPRTLMEVCGGQTHGLLRYGIDAALDGVVRLIHGPGCPVCVTPAEAIDMAIELSRRPDFAVASFGDMLRVPGSAESLLDARADGGRVHVVYSPLDAVRLAQQHPVVHVVFFAVGFETTVPATALAVQQADRLALTNFSLLVSHVRVQPAMEIQVAPEVRGACELLGLDPIHVANDGTMLLAVPRGQAAKAIDALSRIPESKQSLRVGTVASRKLAGVVIIRGAEQEVPRDEPIGAPLPRIC